jgi:hypothetical protein
MLVIALLLTGYVIAVSGLQNFTCLRRGRDGTSNLESLPSLTIVNYVKML